MGHTRRDIRARLYDELSEYAFGMTVTLASSYGAGNIQSSDQNLLANADNPAANQYRNIYIYRRNRVAGDQIRRGDALSVTSGVATLTHFGPNWTNTNDPDGELLVIDPDELNRMINTALDQLKVPCPIPLGHGPKDKDLQEADAMSWDDNATNLSTNTKQATATEVFRGARSLQHVLSADSGYTLPDTPVAIGDGRPGVVFAIGRVSSGTGGRVAVADGNGTEIDTALTFSEKRWVLARIYFNGTSNRQAQPKIGGQVSGDSLDWQSAWVVRRDEGHFGAEEALPSWLDERMDIIGIQHAEPIVASSDGGDVWLAGAMHWEELTEGEHYHFYRYEADANPYLIEIDRRYRSLLEDPLFLIVNCPYRAPYGVDNSLNDETTETDAPMDLILAQLKILLGERYPDRFGALADKGRIEKVDRTKHYANAQAKSASTGWGGAFRTP